MANNMTPTTRWGRSSAGSRDLATRWGRNGANPFYSQWNDFLRNFESDFFSDDKSLAPMDTQNWVDFAPAVDIEEGKGVFMITADLPGLKADDIKIDVTNRTLKISGMRKQEITKDNPVEGNYYERSFGKFVRTFNLPEAVDSRKIEAHFEDGVLRVVLPKSQVELSQDVKIQSGKPQGWLDRLTSKKEAKEVSDKKETPN